VNKNYLNSALIVLLVVIWGGIIYKYFGTPKAVEQKQLVVSSNASSNYTIAKDTFKLTLNARDPFKTSKHRKTPATSTKPKKTTKKTTKKKMLVWPKIQYFGFVKSATNKTKLVLIKVNGKLHRKREKDNIETLTIVKAYSDSITISLNRQLKTIKRL